MLINALAALRTLYPPEILQYRLWQLVAMLIAAYTVGQLVPVWGPSLRERARGMLGVSFVLLAALVYWDNDRTDPLAAFFFTFAPWALGLAVSFQARRFAEIAASRAEIREQNAREAVMEERARIARELHDMVAHSVTVMVIQAGVVRRRLEAGLAVDHDLLRSIESQGRGAVGELRRTLALLRGDCASTAVPVGLDKLDELVAQVREAGLTITVERRGSAVALLPAVDVSAYRIVQEALTNVLRHSGATSVVVTVCFADDGVHLSVVDNGRAAVDGSGHGLVGMRERVALFGGSLRAGPASEGGFEVHARLPSLVAT
jgi:signal transduction histidine kinase